MTSLDNFISTGEKKKMPEQVLQIEINKIVSKSIRRENIQNQMINAIDDYLFDRKAEFNLSTDDIDKILEKVMKIAKHWYAR